jgi:hypothetical protein
MGHRFDAPSLCVPGHLRIEALNTHEVGLSAGSLNPSQVANLRHSLLAVSPDAEA